jgi:hypothetical protein
MNEGRMAEEKKKQGPVYTGIRKYYDEDAGYAVWLPHEWRQIDMVEGHRGWIFTPYADRYDTCFMCEKITLDFKVTPEDLDILTEGFEAGIKSMPDAIIEDTRYETGKMVVILEVKFSFTENGVTRKRWVKSLYWGEGNLVMIVQGANAEEYDYWMPMFFNTMNSYEVGGA